MQYCPKAHSSFAAALVIALCLVICFMSPAMADSTAPVDNSGELAEMSAFMVTGEETEPVTASFTNGIKTVVSISMVHTALLFGAAHGPGVFADLQARDPGWRRTH